MQPDAVRILACKFLAYLVANRSIGVLDNLLRHLEDVATGRVLPGGA